jgi:hypothetical protein
MGALERMVVMDTNRSSERRERQFPRRVYAILIDARWEQERLQLTGVSASQIARVLNCEPNWPAIEIEMALFALDDAREAQQ